MALVTDVTAVVEVHERAPDPADVRAGHDSVAASARTDQGDRDLVQAGHHARVW